MLRLVRHVLPCLAICVLLTGCGPGTSKEHRYWEAHKEAATSHGVRWPGFSPVLEELMQRIEPVWVEALAMTDTTAQTARMKEINKAVGRLVGRLEEVSHKIDGVKSAVMELRAVKADHERARLRDGAVKAARRALEEVEAVMSTAKPNSEVAALTALEPVISRLIGVQSHLERALDQVKFGAPRK